jgi:hypothetical protein
VIFETLQSYELDELPRPNRALCVVEPLALQSEYDVLKNRSPRHQTRILKNHSSVCSRTRHDLSVDHDSARRRRQQAVTEINKSRLAAAAGADDGYELAFVDSQVNIIEREKPAAGARLVVLMS